MEGADARVLLLFYIVVVQMVLMYGLEMWVMPLRIRSLIGGFQYRGVHRSTGR